MTRTMSRTSTTRTYGRRMAGRTKPLLFQTQLPVSPTDRRRRRRLPEAADPVDDLTDQLTFVSLDDGLTLDHFDLGSPETPLAAAVPAAATCAVDEDAADAADDTSPAVDDNSALEDSIESGLRVLTWSDVCPRGDRIEKIAEASYAEVYRVTNARGTSIIKAIRLASPIKAQTKQQARSGLVDEAPHDEDDLRGELTVSEWLADIPGFVVYKERYIVRGRAPKALLETHQAFHRRAKRQDPDRLQFYPSPSRYLDDTRFLVIELGDAGKALEDVVLESAAQLWDVFLHVAIALARAEDQIQFEHRDLHEGNLCVRQVSPPRARADGDSPAVVFGHSGLDITILDYGLSRAACDDGAGGAEPIAFDLEKDLSLFTSTHADQCRVYRQMRSYLLKGDRVHLPPACHQVPYDTGPDGAPISWKSYSPYTNVLWLAYLYGYLVRNFAGAKSDLARFRRTTRELWMHLNPDAPPAVLSFPSATDIVRFAVEAGWLTEAQLVGGGGGGGGGDDDSFCSFYSRDDRSRADTSLLLLRRDAADESCGGSESIIEARAVDRDESALRRSPRRQRPTTDGDRRARS